MVGSTDDLRYTATEAAGLLGDDVTRHTIAMWVARGRLAACGKRGRCPLYRWGDLVAAERLSRQTAMSSRHKSRRTGFQRATTLAA